MGGCREFTTVDPCLGYYSSGPVMNIDLNTTQVYKYGRVNIKLDGSMMYMDIDSINQL
jgi:hypothetical protein